MDRFEIASMLHFRLVSRTLGLNAAFWPVVCAAALGSTACSSLDPRTDECEDVQSCRVQIPDEPPPPPDSGPPVDPSTLPWGCLDVPFVPQTPLPENVAFGMAVVDFNNPTDQVALPNLRVQVCQIQDFICAQPLTGNPPDMPGPITVLQNIPNRPAPLFVVGLPTNAQLPLYLRLFAPNYLQTEYYFVDELTLNLDGVGTADMPPFVLGETITLPQTERIDEFFDQVGGDRNPDAGLVALRTFDCLGNRARNVSLELLTETTGTELAWVFSDGAPTPGTHTDRQGVAGFANVVPAAGASRIRVQGITPDGRAYGDITVNVRPNTLTFAEVRPEGAYRRGPPPTQN